MSSGRAPEVEEEVEENKISITAGVITGNLAAELDVEKKGFLVRLWEKIVKTITGRVVDEPTTNETIEVIIEENSTEYEIEYETPAPTAKMKSL